MIRCDSRNRRLLSPRGSALSARQVIHLGGDMSSFLSFFFLLLRFSTAWTLDTGLLRYFSSAHRTHYTVETRAYPFWRWRMSSWPPFANLHRAVFLPSWWGFFFSSLSLRSCFFFWSFISTAACIYEKRTRLVNPLQKLWLRSQYGLYRLFILCIMCNEKRNVVRN